MIGIKLYTKEGKYVKTENFPTSSKVWMTRTHFLNKARPLVTKKELVANGRKVQK